jgi:hypothetical protein
VSNSVLESLANADEKGIIEVVKEVYLDFFVADPDLFILKTPSISDLGDEEFKASQKQFLKQAEDSLFAVCLALRRVPNITYSLDSPRVSRHGSSESTRKTTRTSCRIASTC